VHLVELFAVVLVGLFALVGAFGKGHSKGVVMGFLYHHSAGIGYHSVVTQMVGEVEIVYASFNVSSINQYSFQRTKVTILLTVSSCTYWMALLKPLNLKILLLFMIKVKSFYQT